MVMKRIYLHNINSGYYNELNCQNIVHVQRYRVEYSCTFTKKKPMYFLYTFNFNWSIWSL